MAGCSGTWDSPLCVETTTNPQIEKNKFVFVSRDYKLPKPSTVLINPHFKEKKSVFLNPNFKAAKNEPALGTNIHVNPNILKCVTPASRQVPSSENYNLENISKATYSSFKSDPVMSINRKYTETVESRNNQIKKIHIPDTSYVRKNYFQTQKPNSFCKINSAIDNYKKVFTKLKIGTVPQNIQEQSIVKPIHTQKVAVPIANKLGSTQKCNNMLDSTNSKEIQRKVHTRLKIVNISKNEQQDSISSMRKTQLDIQSRDKSISTRFKYIRKVETSPKASQPFNIKKSRLLKTPITKVQKEDLLENVSTRRNSIITRFKYIRNGAKLVKINKNPVKSKYKIVNKISSIPIQVEKTSAKINSSPYRKKYVFLNKYNSSTFIANNVIFKKSKQRNLININGILYQNSPWLLKRASAPSTTKRISSGVKGKAPVRQLLKCQGKYKIIRSQVASTVKLKKSNVTCLMYKKTGKCNGQKTGTCIKVHNPNQIILCKRFLQGICHNNNCLLSHKVSSEKMPTCKFFLEGLCNKTDCQYLHVKISPNADICKDFLEGFCKEGIKCNKRHQFLCPEYEKSQKCSKPICGYPHGTSKVIKSERKKFKKIALEKAVKPTKKLAQEITDNCQIRYYKENSDETEETHTYLKRANTEDNRVLCPKRQKLGLLPSFIPIL